MAHSQPPSAMPSSHSASGISIIARRVPLNIRRSNPLGLPQSATSHTIPGHSAQVQSSRELGLTSDSDEIEDRELFVQEYNQLAKKVRIDISI